MYDFPNAAARMGLPALPAHSPSHRLMLAHRTNTRSRNSSSDQRQLHSERVALELLHAQVLRWLQVAKRRRRRRGARGRGRARDGRVSHGAKWDLS